MLYKNYKTPINNARIAKIKVWIILISVLFLACSKDKEVGGKKNNHPYSRYMLTKVNSYVEIPHDGALNPNSAITLEGWVRIDNTAGINVLVSKKTDYREDGYSVDVRKRDGESKLYSYMGYSGSEHRSGNFPIHTWTHWAVTSDGLLRRHYINGELTGEFAEEPGAFTPGLVSLFLAKTVSVNTGFAELRLWNVVRSQSEIKQAMNLNIEKPQSGLVSVWPLHKNAEDIIGSHHGTLHNNPRFMMWNE